MYRLIALDVDGTLLSSSGQILPSTVEAIAWARSLGVRVVLCTGRSALEAAWLSRLAGCDDRAVCLSGGAVADAVTGAHLHQFPLPPNAAQAAMSIIQDYPFLCLDVFAGPHNLVTPLTRSFFAAQQPNDGLLAPDLRAELKALVDAKLSMFPADIQGKARAELWTRFNRRFRIAEYAQLPAGKMADARDYIITLELNALKAVETRKAAVLPMLRLLSYQSRKRPS